MIVVKNGFTLIELVLVLLIIGMLAAWAMQWCQHAILKSRFGTVMRSAKAIATAQEVYYLLFRHVGIFGYRNA